MLLSARAYSIQTFSLCVCVYRPPAVPIDVQCAESRLCAAKSMSIHSHTEDIFQYSFFTYTRSSSANCLSSLSSFYPYSHAAHLDLLIALTLIKKLIFKILLERNTKTKNKGGNEEKRNRGRVVWLKLLKVPLMSWIIGSIYSSLVHGVSVGS